MLPHKFRLLPLAFVLFTTFALAQSPDASSSAGPSGSSAQDAPTTDPASDLLPAFALGLRMSTFGPGIQVGTALTETSNLRLGFSAINYGRGFEEDGIDYNGELALRSIDLHYDWFPFAGAFYVSPGMVFFLKEPVTGSAFVPPGEIFTLNDEDYRSDPRNPIRGSGELRWNTVAPTFTVGWGNFLPRGGKRFSFPFEIGIAIIGTPKVSLDFQGGACERNGLGCRNVTSDPEFQRDLNAQRRDINDDIAGYKVYPIVSAGFSYRF